MLGCTWRCACAVKIDSSNQLYTQNMHLATKVYRKLQKLSYRGHRRLQQLHVCPGEAVKVKGEASSSSALRVSLEKNVLHKINPSRTATRFWGHPFFRCVSLVYRSSSTFFQGRVGRLSHRALLATVHILGCHLDAQLANHQQRF